MVFVRLQEYSSKTEHGVAPRVPKITENFRKTQNKIPLPNPAQGIEEY